MMEKIPPHNEEAERSILGASMLSKDALLDIMDIVKPRDFYSEMHKEIFTAIRDLYSRSTPVDTLTVSEELKKRNSLEMVGGRAYIASLSSACLRQQTRHSTQKSWRKRPCSEGS